MLTFVFGTSLSTSYGINLLISRKVYQTYNHELSYNKMTNHNRISYDLIFETLIDKKMLE